MQDQADCRVLPTVSMGIIQDAPWSDHPQVDAPGVSCPLEKSLTGVPGLELRTRLVAAMNPGYGPGG